MQQARRTSVKQLVQRLFSAVVVNVYCRYLAKMAVVVVAIVFFYHMFGIAAAAVVDVFDYTNSRNYNHSAFIIHQQQQCNDCCNNYVRTAVTTVDCAHACLSVCH